jgi:ubiquinone/menaquinone biosynthesis C-methylase UbiE
MNSVADCQVAEYQEVLCEAYRVLKRGGLLLVHEVSKDLVCAWEGMEPSDIAPDMDRVGHRAALIR